MNALTAIHVRRCQTSAALLCVLLSALCKPVLAATCNLSIGSLSFGSYVGAQISSTSSASFTCTKTAPGNTPERVDYTVSLSTGAGSYAQRTMTRTALPADTLAYNLYLNLLPPVLNTSVWGDGTGTTVRWTGSMNLTSGNPTRTDTATLVGAIPAGSFPSAGTYQDTVVATVVIL
jgi:spore coat protein U-like protein